MLLFCSFNWFILLLPAIVKGSSLKGEDNKSKIEFKNEKRYPNGTVIGRYTYKDKDGIPVHVKYFADDSSYGVELKSVKIFGIDNELVQEKLPYSDKTTLSDELLHLNEITSKVNQLFTNAPNNTFQELNPYLNKLKTNTNFKSNDGYEVFLEKDLKPFGKNNKEKVRVYYDGNKKKARKFNQYKPFIY